MGNEHKDIKITPNTGESASPKIEVTGGNNATKTITINDDGTISFDSTIAATSGSVADGNANLVTGDAVFDYIAAQGFTTNTGDITGVDLTGGTGVTIGSETGTTSGNYSSTISIGQAVGTGDSVTFANVTIAGDIIHSGDTNNLISFGTDTQSFETGGTARMNISDSGLQIGSGARVTTIITQSDGIGSNDNETTLPTSAAVKDYVDSNAGGSPGGSDTFIQYNNGGSFGATTLSYDDTADAEQYKIDVSSSVAPFVIVQTGTGNAFEIHDAADPDSNRFEIDQFGRAAVQGTAGTSSASLYVGGNISSAGRIRGVGATAASPSFATDSDTNTGIFFPASDTIGFSTAGSEILRFGSSGEILIGGSAAGSDGQVLTSGGSGAAVSWTTISGGGGASVIGGLTDVSMDITNFVDGFLLQTNSDGSAPTTGTLNNATGNIGIGKDVLKTITSADENVAIGTQAGDSITTGGRNILIGEFAGEAIDTAANSVIIGARAGRAIHNRSSAIMIGRDAGENAQSTGVVFIGHSAGAEATGDQYGYNIAIGADSGEYGANSTYSLVIGKSAGKGDSTNTNNPNFMTAVGHFAMTAITTGDDNSAFGYQAMNAVTTGSDNTAVGSEALHDVTTGDRNIAIGYRAADGFDTESDNIAIGFNALGGSVAGAEYNVVIGNYAGDAITSADNSVIIGHNAGTAVTTGAENVMIGYQSGYGITDGGSNIFIGQSTGFSGGSNEQGNVGIGHLAMSSIANADYNVGVGYKSGRYVKGQHNVYVGYESGNDSSNTGSKNIGVGYQAGNNITTGSNNVVIGAADVSSATGNSQLSISSGDGGVTWITGTSAGHVSLGNFTFDADQTVGSGQDNYVLTYDNSAGTIGLEEASGGSTSPAGSDGQIQYNNGGSFGGDADFTWDDSNNRLVIGSTTSQHDSLGKLTVKGTDASFLLEKHDNSASGGPSMTLYRYSASVADGDLIGQVNFRGEGHTGNPSTYISMRAEIEDTTEGTKDGSLIVRGLVNNSQTVMAEIHGEGLTLSQGTFNGNMGTDTYKPAVFMDNGTQTITTTESTVGFNTEILDPAGNAALSSTDGHIQLTTGGYYRISYSIPINDQGSISAQDRTMVFCFMQTDDNDSFSSPTLVNQSRAQVYTREASGGSGLSTSFIYEHTANDYIRLRIDLQQTLNVGFESNTAQISIEYLGPA